MEEKLGDRIRKHRIQRGLSQTQLSKGLCSSSAISQIEYNKILPSVDLLPKIAARLEVPVERLVYGEDYVAYQNQLTVALDLMDKQSYSEATAIFESLLHDSKCLSMLPKSRILYSLGICYIEQYMFDWAIDTLRQVINEVPTDLISDLVLLSDAHNAMSRAYEEKGMHFKQRFGVIRQVCH